MSKLDWFNFIPFLNQYDVWARIVVFLCLIIAVGVLLFAPRHPQSSSVSSVQETKIDKSTKIDEVKGDYVAGDKVVYPTYESKAEHGTWSPSVRYTTGDSSKDYVKKILVDSAEYILNQRIVKISFDFSVDLKQVPSGSALAIGGLPVVVKKGNVTEFNVHQTGLNYSGELTVSARHNTTWFDLVTLNTGGVQGVYVTDGSEGSVRFWGYIVYKCD